MRPVRRPISLLNAAEYHQAKGRQAVNVMSQTLLHSDFDSLILAIPFVATVLASYFRLDEVIATPKERKHRKSLAFGLDKDGRLCMTDPDGRPWNAVHRPGDSSR
jgi:hypothetical protein